MDFQFSPLRFHVEKKPGIRNQTDTAHVPSLIYNDLQWFSAGFTLEKNGAVYEIIAIRRLRFLWLSFISALLVEPRYIFIDVQFSISISIFEHWSSTFYFYFHFRILILDLLIRLLFSISDILFSLSISICDVSSSIFDFDLYFWMFVFAFRFRL